MAGADVLEYSGADTSARGTRASTLKSQRRRSPAVLPDAFLASRCLLSPIAGFGQ